MIDTILDSAIRCRLRVCQETDDLLGWNGGLGTCSARIYFAYSTGLIGYLMHLELKIVNDIRNRFAHDVIVPDQHHQPTPISFETQSIRDMCKKLKLPEIMAAIHLNPPLVPKTPQHEFVMSVVAIVACLQKVVNGGQSGIIEASICSDAAFSPDTISEVIDAL